MAKIDANLKRAFTKIKEELEDHLQAINENTGEIQSNHNFLVELERKMDKLYEKLEEVQIVLSKLEIPVEASLKIKPLSVNERQAFVTIYAASQPITYQELAQQCNFTESLCKSYVDHLIEKKIPVIISYQDGVAHLTLDKAFKELQAKENVVGLDQKSLKETY